MARGQCYGKLGNLEDAIRDFETGLDINPHHINMRIRFLEVLIRAENYEMAEKGENED